MAMLMALEERYNPITTIIIRGENKELKQWQRQCLMPYHPTQQVFAIDKNAANLPDALAAKISKARTVACICSGQTCGEPVDELDLLINQLN